MTKERNLEWGTPWLKVKGTIRLEPPALACGNATTFNLNNAFSVRLGPTNASSVRSGPAKAPSIGLNCLFNRTKLPLQYDHCLFNTTIASSIRLLPLQYSTSIRLLPIQTIILCIISIPYPVRQIPAQYDLRLSYTTILSLIPLHKRIDSMSQATNWANKHHFIVGKTKKTYLTDCENSHELKLIQADET